GGVVDVLQGRNERESLDGRSRVDARIHDGSDRRSPREMVIVTAGVHESRRVIEARVDVVVAREGMKRIAVQHARPVEDVVDGDSSRATGREVRVDEDPTPFQVHDRVVDEVEIPSWNTAGLGAVPD